MNTMSPGGWQGYSPGPNQNWNTSPGLYQPVNNQSPFGQNGGNMTTPQQAETPFVGRYINQIEEVMPREVPMDGRVAIFPTQSLEEIYLKAWDRNGSIRTFRYILDPTQNLNAQNAASEPDMATKILDRLEQLEHRFDEAQQSKPTNQRRAKGGEE